MKIVWGISGSFCNHALVIEEMEKLKRKGWDLKVVLSENVAHLDTRFFSCKSLREKIQELCDAELIESLTQAELIGPHCPYDAMVIAPCTSTLISKLAYGNYDHPCALAAKAMLRNDKPIILAVASNDLLGNTAEALFKLKQTKNIYLVPFYQDDAYKKANSCISQWKLIEKTVYNALEKKQLQPILYQKMEDYDEKDA